MADSVDSILVTVKKLLGISPDDTGFDVDIITGINSVFMTLNQLGIGPADTFSIEDSTATFSDFLGDDVATYSAVRSYIYMKVRLMFDPPASGPATTSLENLVQELEYRLRTQQETRPVVPPVEPV